MTGIPAFLGIDGGGTKTDVAIVDADGAVLARRQGPTSNRAVIGLERAIDVLGTLISDAAAEAGLDLPLGAGWIGMAGSDRPEDREAFTAALSHMVRGLRVTNDAELVLSGTPDGTGIALIAGTGSIAYARNAAGVTGRSGGWGHIFGDEGSAFTVAVEALRAVAAAADRRGPETRLTEAMLTFWDAGTPQQLITRVYAPEVKKGDIAAATPQVVEAAESGDAVALAILTHAADDLAALVMSLARRIPFDAPPIVACTGGLILRSAIVRNRVAAGLDADLARGDLLPMNDIAVSAARAARRLAPRGTR
jgi:N-acetylglucosamine kinase-like BadF-type ATPase